MIFLKEKEKINELLSDTNFAYKLKKIWLWNESFVRKYFNGSEVGIDLVALTHDGDYRLYNVTAFRKILYLINTHLILFFHLRTPNLEMERVNPCEYVIQTSNDIVKANGGEIEVATKENEGTIFFIYLPVT